MLRLIADKITERLLYISEVIFENILKTPYVVSDISNITDFDTEREVVLNYSSINIPGSIRLPVSGLLSEYQITNHEPGYRNDVFPKLFPADADCYDLDFDIFSASFYLVSEYEKYSRQVFDMHERYKENEYFYFKKGLYKEPLVNRYAEHLWEMLSAKHRFLTRQQNKFDYKITIDVDQPWAFLHKGFRSYAGFLKDLMTMNFDNFRARQQSLMGNKDPFYTFDWLHDVCPPEKTIFFFLIDGNTKFDGKHNSSNQHYADLIRKTNEKGFACGIHPSYNSFLSANEISKQKDHLSEILNREVNISRQHYLRYRLPQTYRALIDAGIQHDYTTSMISRIGFRNGIANEFNWFDLEKNVKTDLILHPAMAMDVSLKNYLGYDAEYAFNMVLEQIDKTILAGGTFSFIWHNSNLSELNGWKEWKSIFSELLKYLDSKLK